MTPRRYVRGGVDSNVTAFLENLWGICVKLLSPVLMFEDMVIFSDNIDGQIGKHHIFE